MFKYELKKIFFRTGSIIAMGILLLLIGLVCWFATDVYYVDRNGVKQRGPSAVAKLRAEQKAWAGYLDEKKLRRVIAENKKIKSSPEYQSENETDREIAYSRGQGFEDIRTLLNKSFAREFREYDYYRADRLSEESALRFYENRVKLLKEWLEGEANEQYSDGEKAFFISRYEDIETPFYYDYATGWSRLFEYAPTLVMVMLLVLGYLVSGIFSNEFSWKADAVFFSSYYGRNRATAAKIAAGFCVVTGVYLTAMLIYSAVVLLYLGADGWSCPVQILFSGWKSFYNIAVWQEYLLIWAGGYVGCLFIAFLGMWVSAKTKSAVLAVTVPFVLIFIPSFLGNIRFSLVGKILGLLPDQLLQMGNVVGYFNVYSFGGKVVGAAPVLLVVYAALIIPLAPGMYRGFRHMEIG
jgi:hypothetical protein